MPSTRCGRAFALVDCDNFYVSCERVFQPKLRDRPVVVLSNNDGVIVARSPEVKALGIGMGKPFHQVKDIIQRERAAVFSSNYTLYDDMSRRVMETLAELTPDVNIYSIDEAFLSLHATDGKQYGHRIRATVFKNTGIPVTVGIGSTKTLAKLAAEYAKQRQLPVLDLTAHPEPDAVLSAIRVQDIWGIGVHIAEWLYRRGINTALDLKHIGDGLIRERAGITGLRVVFELRGISCIPLRPMTAPRKGITSSRSFGRYVTSLEDLRESVATHATRAAEKLRQDGSVTGLLSIFITTNVYTQNPQYAKTVSIPVIPPSNASHELVRLAHTALERIFRPGYRYIKAGVTATGILPADQQQVDMFALRDSDRLERLYQSVDRINRAFGTATLQPAACGITQPWAMRRDYRSQRFTTCWDELPIAMARGKSRVKGAAERRARATIASVPLTPC